MASLLCHGSITDHVKVAFVAGCFMGVAAVIIASATPFSFHSADLRQPIVMSSASTVMTTIRSAQPGSIQQSGHEGAAATFAANVHQTKRPPIFSEPFETSHKPIDASLFNWVGAITAMLLVWWFYARRQAQSVLNPLCPHPASHPLAVGAMPMLNVLGEQFDTYEQRMEAVRRMYLDGDVFVLDVRTPEEVAATGTLKKAVNIPHTALEQAEEQLPPFRDTPIIVFCKSGYRAGIAEQILVEMEYFDVINAGGYEDVALLDLYELYKDRRTFVLDVRRPDEVAAGTLRKAKNIEYQLLPEAVAELPFAKDTPILVFCKAGQRSEIARQSLQSMGYTNVTNGGGYEMIKFFDE